MEFDFSRLKGRIIERFGSFASFAHTMGMTKPALHNRLKGFTAFRPEEIIKAAELLGICPSELHLYFFTPKVR